MVASLCLLQMFLAVAQHGIQSQYDVFAKAYVKNDVIQMLAILDHDYVLINAKGTQISRTAYERTLTLRNLNRETSLGYSVEILSTRAEGGIFVVHTKETQLDRIGHVHEYEDRWRWRDGSWLLFQTKTLSEN